MIPFVLPNILLIAENSNSQEYVKHILIHLKRVMKISEPIQILLIFMQKMDLLLKLTPAEDVKTDVLPMLYRALESDAQQIQELCLSILPTFASLVDYPSMKNALLPRIKKLCITTQLVSVRVNCLLCIGKLLEHLDKWLVMDEIIPFLPQIPSREPAVLMAILGIYTLALTHSKLGLTKEALATKVIPFLVPLSIENGLSLTQFNAMMTLVKDMINRVEGEHRTKLEQLTSIQKESSGMKFQNDLVPNAKSPSKNESDDVFSDLGLEQFLNDMEESGNTPTGMSMSTSSSSMSLQEKQRLTQQQEQNQRLQSQASIAPKQAPLKITNKPKDLTSSLVDNNLSQLKVTSSKSVNNNSWFNTSTNSFTPQNQAAPCNSFANFQVPAPVSNQRPKVSKKTDDWGAFDDLLPSKKEKVPLNQMKGSSSTPSGFVVSSNPNNNFGGLSNRKNNELSADDIMEFLN